jgi:hypothetical protein
MMRDDYDVDRLNTIFVQLIYPGTKGAILDEPLRPPARIQASAAIMLIIRARLR